MQSFALRLAGQKMCVITYYGVKFGVGKCTRLLVEEGPTENNGPVINVFLLQQQSFSNLC